MEAPDIRPVYPYNAHARYHFDYLCPPDQPQPFGYFVMYQIGELYAQLDYKIVSHVQYCHEISYIASGRGEYYINGKWFPVTKGDIILTRKGDTHDGISSDDDPYRTLYFGFDFVAERCRTHPYAEIVALFGSPNQYIIHKNSEIGQFYVGIFEELIGKRPYYADYVEAYALQLMLTVCRAFLGGDRVIYNPSHDIDLNNQLVHRLAQYLETNVEKIGNLTDIARDFRYSYSHLAHLFKSKVGMSMYQYYNKQRFDRATELLQTGRMTVTEVAEKLNYQSLHAFSKAFRGRFGVSPSQYQEIAQRQSYYQHNKQKG